MSREAEICYATMNLVTDYDAWHALEEPVTIEMILENMRLNIDSAKAIIKKAVGTLSVQRSSGCECARALKNCIITDPDLIPEDIKDRLRFIIGKYIK